ncbi:MAG: hypothetical protein C4524_14600 [Candidatus Zixiibacteriota bacterium]|nr:MAG: hypothetical protein C4524_14600 [candidate division Zixibacteria bacterium]
MTQRRPALRNCWQSLILESYPPDARAFFGNRRSRFQNPVGAALDGQMEALLDALAGGDPASDSAALSDDWIKIRAVQGFDPSVALNFIPLLKQALRETLEPDLHQQNLRSELQDLEMRLDRLLLAAFDRYMEARETMYQIRIGEWRRSTYLARRMGAADPTEAPATGEET